MIGISTVKPDGEALLPDGAAPDPSRTVYVIDDNVDVRKSLHFALASCGLTVWPFGRPRDFIDEVANLPPAPILLDIRMPEIDGVQVLEMLRERAIDWPVIMMSAHGDISVAVAAMKLGATDFLEKPFAIQRLEQLLDVAFNDLKQTVENARRGDELRKKLATLSPRERQVAQALVEAKTTKVIAQDLGLSDRTVEIFRRGILAKLEVSNTASVVRILVEAGGV